MSLLWFAHALLGLTNRSTHALSLDAHAFILLVIHWQPSSILKRRDKKHHMTRTPMSRQCSCLKRLHVGGPIAIHTVPSAHRSRDRRSDAISRLPCTVSGLHSYQTRLCFGCGTVRAGSRHSIHAVLKPSRGRLEHVAQGDSDSVDLVEKMITNLAACKTQSKSRTKYGFTCRISKYRN